jgi:hypothetical protein
MNHQLRFADLKESGIVKSWAQLKRLQELHDFPFGRLLSPNIRTWDEEEEIAPWLASRPVENARPLQGAPRAKHERRMAGATLGDALAIGKAV